MPKTLRRRRQEAKTDYKSRLALLKSDKPRLVVRKTNKHIIAQIVETEIAQDKTLFGTTSQSLVKLGWTDDSKGSLKSRAAAYVTGYILGKIAKDKIKGDVILDAGMYRNIQKSRIYAVLKGAVDAGLNVTHDEKIFPTEEQIKSNEKLAALVDKLTK